MADDLFSLSPAERLARFRELAKEARMYAARLPELSPDSDAYLRIAEQWERLARDLEANMPRDA